MSNTIIKTKKLSFRATEEEYVAIKNMAKAEGLSMQDYLFHRAFNYQVGYLTELRVLTKELRNENVSSKERREYLWQSIEFILGKILKE